MGDGIRRDRQVVGPHLVGIRIPPPKGGGEVGVYEKQKLSKVKKKGGEVWASG